MPTDALQEAAYLGKVKLVMAEPKDNKLERRKPGKDDTTWEPEVALDLAATLEELINEPPFKEVSEGGEQSVTAAARIPLWLLRRIIKLRELSGSPYGLNSDVIRDAIYIGLRVLHLRYGMTPDWAVETKLAAAVDAVSAGRRVREQIDQLIAGLDEMVRDGDIDKAVGNLTGYVQAAEELDNDWHRGKVFQLLADSKVVSGIISKCDAGVRKAIKTGKSQVLEG